MTPADLDLVVAHTHHERYRELTADDHPDREFYRRQVAVRAAEFRGTPCPPPAATTAPLTRAEKPRRPLGAPLPKG